MNHQQVLMEEAAFAEADESIARALRDMPVLYRHLDRVADEKATGAANLVMQWVKQAARHRHIRALGDKGDTVKFDPIYFEDFDEVGFEIGNEVRIVKPPIVRGEGDRHVVLLRGEVA
jgi:hypothetical protein